MSSSGGSGTPAWRCKAVLVVLPGLDGLAALSSAFVEAVRPSFDQVVAISYSSDEALGYKELETYVRGALPTGAPFVLLAQSFSGPIALSIAASRPHGLIGLVLSTTFSKSPLPGLSPLARIAPVRSLPRALLSWWLLGRWATQQLESVLCSSLRAVESDVLRSRAASALSVNESPHLNAISIPVLYLQASDDRLLPRSAGARVLGAIPHAEAASIGGPHLLLQAAPAACAEVVAKFASRLQWNNGDGGS
jgi:pimeloyl-ACP methyl ester carboxylesterase